MKIIISPAKKMKTDTDTIEYQTTPVFLEETKELLEWFRKLSFEEAKKLWNCNEKIASQNYERIQKMDLEAQLTPAILSYEGIQYQYMAPAVFEEKAMEYIQEHLRILSGFYGVVRPLDGIRPYRLEMQAKAKVNGTKDLYGFWKDKIYRQVAGKGETILNLASKEYSKCVEDYLGPEDRCLTCVFGEWSDGKVRQKGTLAKMARGEMVRYMAEESIEDVRMIQGFDRLGYRFRPSLSSEDTYVFLKEESQNDRSK